MKKIILKLTALSLIATTLGSTTPTTAMERVDLESAKPYLIGAGVAAVVGFSGWFFFGNREKTPSLSDQVSAELAPLKREIEELKQKLTEAQRAEAINLIKENLKDEEFLESLKDLIRQTTVPFPGTHQTTTLPESPRPAHRKLSFEGQPLTASPAKKRETLDKRIALSQHQQNVEWALDKAVISDRVWKFLEGDNDDAQAVALEINSPENREASFFDFKFFNANGCKLLITIGSKTTEKKFTFKK